MAHSLARFALRLLRGTNEIEVRVKLPEEQREDIHHLEDLVIRTPSGAEVPLLDVADVEKDEAFSAINRRDGRRAINVSMDIEPKRAITQVIQALRRRRITSVARRFPRHHLEFRRQRCGDASSDFIVVGIVRARIGSDLFAAGDRISRLRPAADCAGRDSFWHRRCRPRSYLARVRSIAGQLDGRDRVVWCGDQRLFDHDRLCQSTPQRTNRHSKQFRKRDCGDSDRSCSRP